MNIIAAVYPVSRPRFFPGVFGILMGFGLLYPGLVQGAPPIKPAWELTVPSDCDSSPAVGPNGDIYFGTFIGQLWSVSPAGGRQWQFDTGMEIGSSPAVGTDGVIYFGCRDRHLYALTPKGKLKWRFKTGAWVDASPALGSDGRIYFGSWDTNFYALDADGREVWRLPTHGPVTSSAAIARDGTIYFGSHDGRLRAVTAAGRELWSFKTGGPIISSPALDEAGRVFFTSVDGQLYAVEADGKLHWKLRTGGVGPGSPVIGQRGMIFVAAHRELWAVTPEGRRAWVSGGDDIETSPVISADGTVMFVFAHGQIQGCDQDRSLASQWSAGIAYTGEASPTISSGRFVVLVNRLLRAYEWEAPLAGVAWPKFRANARNTGNQADASR